MPKIEEILEKQEKILSKARQLGFKSVRLCKSSKAGALAIMLDMDQEEPIEDNDNRCIALHYQAALDLGCQVLVCSNAYFDGCAKSRFCREGVCLPCKDASTINRVFGKNFQINSIESDSEFNQDKESYKEIYESFFPSEKINENSSSLPLRDLGDLEKKETAEILRVTTPTKNIQPFLKRCKLKKDGDKLPTSELAFRRAAAAGLEAVTRALVENAKNLDINQTGTESGKTALHFAAMHKRKNVISQLIQMGAKQDIRDAQGKLASDYVEDERLKKLFKVV